MEFYKSEAMLCMANNKMTHTNASAHTCIDSKDVHTHWYEVMHNSCLQKKLNSFVNVPPFFLQCGVDSVPCAVCSIQKKLEGQV